MAVEAFSRHRNLVLAGAITDGCLVTPVVTPSARYVALSAFERPVGHTAVQLRH